MGYSTFQYKDPDEYVSDDTYTTWVAWQAASKELATVTEQRDALAEALGNCRDLCRQQSADFGCYCQDCEMLNIIDKALQSLNQPNYE